MEYFNIKMKWSLFAIGVFMLAILPIFKDVPELTWFFGTIGAASFIAAFFLAIDD